MVTQRIDKYYKHVVAEDLIVLYNYKTIFSLPFFEKATFNSTSKKFVGDKRNLLFAFSASFLALKQTCIESRARKAIAAFQLRKFVVLGSKTTLRNTCLSSLLDKLLIFVYPNSSIKMIESRSILKAHFLESKNPMQFSILWPCKSKICNTWPLLTCANFNSACRIEIASDQRRARLCKSKICKGHENTLQTNFELYLALKNEKLLGFFPPTDATGFVKQSLQEYTSFLLKNFSSLIPSQPSLFKPDRALQNRREAITNKSLYCTRNQFTVAYNNLLILPELKKFFPFFEIGAGFSFNICFKIPKINVCVQNVDTNLKVENKFQNKSKLNFLNDKRVQNLWFVCFPQDSSRIDASQKLTTFKQLSLLGSNVDSTLNLEFYSTLWNVALGATLAYTKQSFVRKLARGVKQNFLETNKKFDKLVYLSLNSFQSNDKNQISQFLLLNKRKLFVSAFQYPIFF